MTPCPFCHCPAPSLHEDRGVLVCDECGVRRCEEHPPRATAAAADNDRRTNEQRAALGLDPLPLGQPAR